MATPTQQTLECVVCDQDTGEPAVVLRNVRDERWQYHLRCIAGLIASHPEECPHCAPSSVNTAIRRWRETGQLPEQDEYPCPCSDCEQEIIRRQWTEFKRRSEQKPRGSGIAYLCEPQTAPLLAALLEDPVHRARFERMIELLAQVYPLAKLPETLGEWRVWLRESVAMMRGEPVVEPGTRQEEAPREHA